MVESYSNAHSKEQMKQLGEALDSGMFVHVRMMLNEMPASDVAHLLESSPPRVRNLLWKLVNAESEGEILNNLNEEIRNGFVGKMAPKELALALEGLELDDLADIIGELPESIYLEVMASMSEQDRTRIEAALVYPEDTAGGLMNIDTITIRPKITLEVVLRYLRMKGLPESTDSIYVVDTNDKFIGAISLATLITSNPESSVEQVLDNNVESIPASLPENEVAQLFERRDLISAPVVDETDKLLGRITIDDVVDVIREEAEHSFMGMAGLDETDDTFAPVWSSAKRRAIWLGINLITALVAVTVIGMFEETIAAVTALAILQPIVPSMGGVAGTQTLTLVIRGMSLGHIIASNSRWLILKELGVSIINGILWALTVGALTYFWFSHMRGDPNGIYLALALGGAMTINLVVGVLCGATLPIILKRMNIDPAISGGVILTTVTDVVGFFGLLGLATLFFT